MSSPDELDRLLALGSPRSDRAACVEPSAIDEAQLLAYRRGDLGARQQEEIEKHLVACPFCRELLAHIRVERRPRWPALAAVAIAAIAAAVLFAITPAPRDPIGPYAIVEVRGQVATHRDQPDAGAREFRPESQVAIKIEPSSGRAASLVRAFRLEEGVLVPVDAAIEPGAAGVFWIKGAGRALFGDAPGSKRLVILAADRDADLSNVPGRSLAAAQALTTQTSWLPFLDAQYRLE